MIYDILSAELKKHLFIVYSDRFSSETSATHFERYVAKHFLLKPELIIINDQIHGFKKISDKVKSLENYPVFIEIEYSLYEEDVRLIENIDLYAEVNSKFSDKVTDLSHLASIYSKGISVERVQQLNDPSTDSMLIYSKLGDLFSDGYLEQDIEEGVLGEAELRLMIDVQLVSFVNFIKLFDDIVTHNKNVHSIDTLFQNPIKETE